MRIEYRGMREIKSSIAFLEGVRGAAFDEIVTIKSPDAPPRIGRIIALEENRATILVFEGTRGLSPQTTRTTLTGRFLEMPLSEEILGRVFDGLGRPKDGLGTIRSEVTREINAAPPCPTERVYPRDFIATGFSAIDGLATLIRGQKLPIFSADGLPHDKLAARIAVQATIGGENFAVVFGAMGISHDTADFFRKTFAESGNSERTVAFLNTSSDPPAERLATPRFALTAAEFLAFEKGYHVLVILTDMTAYAEALREISSTRGEIPGRKGFPCYMYSDLASIYERAGIRRGRRGSVTQIPIVTMPADDITHPVPDLTGFITEGQIVLDRALHRKGIFPPINPLPSLSRLMKDGIGENFTTADHPRVAKKLFAAYVAAQNARALASVIGEEELSEEDIKSLDFAEKFEKNFLHQKNARSIYETIALGGEIFSKQLLL